MLKGFSCPYCTFEYKIDVTKVKKFKRSYKKIRERAVEHVLKKHLDQIVKELKEYVKEKEIRCPFCGIQLVPELITDTGHCKVCGTWIAKWFVGPKIAQSIDFPKK